MKSFFSTMLKCKKAIYESRNRSAAKAYLKVQDFVASGTYSKCRKAKELISLILDGHDAHYISDYYGLTYDTIRTEIRHISNELWEMFPSDFFDRLLEYNDNSDFIDDCLYSLENRDLTSEKIIFREVTKELTMKGGNPYIGSFSSEEFSEELHFLLMYSTLFLKSDIEGIDVEKVFYLMDLLDGKAGTVTERAELLKSLERGMEND